MTPLQYSYPTQCWCFSEHVIEHALVCLYVFQVSVFSKEKIVAHL